DITDSLKVTLLVRAFQTYGYINANIDPLEQTEGKDKYKIFQHLKNLDYKEYGLTEQDLDKEFIIKTENLSGILAENKPLKLRYIIERLQKAYCSTIGVEFMFNPSRDVCNFIREKF